MLAAEGGVDRREKDRLGSGRWRAAGNCPRLRLETRRESSTGRREQNLQKKVTTRHPRAVKDGQPSVQIFFLWVAPSLSSIDLARSCPLSNWNGVSHATSTTHVQPWRTR